MPTSAERSGDQLTGPLVRAWRCVARGLGHAADEEATADVVELAHEGLATLAAAPPSPLGAGRVRLDPDAVQALAFAALRAISRLADVGTGDERAARVELGYELVQILDHHGGRPEMVCLTCGHGYRVVGLLGCPRCAEPAG